MRKKHNAKAITLPTLYAKMVAMMRFAVLNLRTEHGVLFEKIL